MKRTSLQIAAMLMTCMASYSQDLRNSSNMLIGKIESDGIVRDQTNMMIGKIRSDGTIANRNNMIVGKIEKDGTIRDCSNMKIGKVNSDGEVKDSNNMQIGRVKADGTVVDRNNMTIGFYKNLGFMKMPVTWSDEAQRDYEVYVKGDMMMDTFAYAMEQMKYIGREIVYLEDGGK